MFGSRWSVGRSVARGAWSDARQARGLSENARGRIQQRLQLATEGFPPSVVKERHRDDRWPQVGGLALCPNVKGNQGLLAQPCLHAFPNHFLQRPAVGDYLYFKPEHGTRVKAGNRSHHELRASGGMRDTNLRVACFPLARSPRRPLSSMSLIPQLQSQIHTRVIIPKKEGRTIGND